VTTYAFLGDGSGYAGALAEGLDILGVTLVNLQEPSDIGDHGMQVPGAVVLVNPSARLARELKSFMNGVGGRMSRVPLIAALDTMDRLQDVDTLRVVDDFLVSPGGAGELVYRVKTLGLRRGGEGEVIAFGNLVINLDAHQVFIEGAAVDLTYKEFELLRKLAASPGKAFTRDELLRGIWGYDYYGGTRTVDVHVRRVRAKIEGSRRYIETVHGVGYRFVTS
jgi:DNA-binding response OmpR family regulator